MKILYNNILDKYKKIPAPVKASLWFTVCNVINKGIALLSTPILTRILSQEEYGNFSVYQSWVSIITIFASLNLYQNAYTKGLVKYGNNRNSLTSSLLSLSSFITICFFIVFIVFHSFWEKIFNMSSILISMMFIEVLFMSAFEFWAEKQRFNYKYKMLVLLSIIMSAGKDIEGVHVHMKKHRELIKPKFDFVDRVLHEELDGLDIAKWTNPKGGYFINLELNQGMASRVWELCKNAGVKITPAGSTFPYGKDKEDKFLRLAPTYPSINELEQAMKCLCLAIKITYYEKIEK